jgi:hypothetical protein
MARASLRIAGAGLALTASTLLFGATGYAEPGFTPVQVLPRVLATTAVQDAPYAAVSCPTTGSCTAVGPGGFLLDQAVQAAGRPTVLAESGGVWTSRSALPLPSGASASASKGSTVSDVSCPSPGQCTAVGGYASSSGFIRTLIETKSSGSWTPSSVTLPGDVNDEGTFTSLWCASQGNCVALGFYGGGDTTTINDMVATENAGSWSIATKLPTVKGSVVLLPVSIACSSMSSCTAVAVGLVRGDVERTYAWNDASGPWSRPVSLASSGGLDFLGLSIACPSATTCLVAGELEGTRVTFPVVSTDKSGTWSRPRRFAFPRLTPSTDGGTFDSIACAAGTCEAVGSFSRSDGKGTEGAAATWTGGSWSSVGLVHGIVDGGRPTSTSLLSSVACAAPTTCVAVGAGTLTIDHHPLSNTFATILNTVRTVVAPDPPLHVVGRPHEGGATVTWLPPIDDGGSSILSYVATIAPGGATCTGKVDSCSVKGLRNGRTYEVSVSASNGTSRSALSVRTRFVAGAAPSVPRHLRVMPLGTTAVVTWHASKAPSGEHVERYVVRAVSGTRLRGCSTRALRCTVGGLIRGRTYRFTVVAQDASGVSGSEKVRVVA